MPIYDYSCNSCSHEFEALVRGSSRPTCPECGSQDLERKLSFPAVRSESTKERVRAAVQRRDAAQAKDNAHEQRKYEASHDD
jgi:putative FmdB family regulatory protein